MSAAAIFTALISTHIACAACHRAVVAPFALRRTTRLRGDGPCSSAIVLFIVRAVASFRNSSWFRQARLCSNPLVVVAGGAIVDSQLVWRHGLEDVS